MCTGSSGQSRCPEWVWDLWTNSFSRCGKKSTTERKSVFQGAGLNIKQAEKARIDLPVKLDYNNLTLNVPVVTIVTFQQEAEGHQPEFSVFVHHCWWRQVCKRVTPTMNTHIHTRTHACAHTQNEIRHWIISDN